MGQRQATYIITTRKNRFSEETTILPVYNQWNYVKVQLPKMIRGLKAVLKHDFEYIKFSTVPIDLIYYTAAGISEYSIKNDDGTKKTIRDWVGGRIETDCYRKGEYTAGYREDNNNGWNIIKFIINDDNDKIETEIFCVPGDEDKPECKNGTLEEYFFENSKKDIKYLSQFKWNPKLETEANKLLIALCPAETVINELEKKDEEIKELKYRLAKIQKALLK